MSQDNRLRGELHPKAKLSNLDVIEIRKLYDAGFTLKSIARNFKVSTWNVSNIGKRKSWKWMGG